MKGGFVTRNGAKKGARVSKAALSNQVKSRLAETAGLAAVEDMNPDAHHPCLDPVVPSDAEIYVLMERPEKVADYENDAGRGSGPYLLKKLESKHGIRMAMDYIVRTVTPKDRDPEPYEIEAFRSTVEQDIYDSGCTVVVLAGSRAIRWGMGSSTPKGATEDIARGRSFPGMIKDRPVLFFCAANPRMIYLEAVKASEEARRRKRDVQWNVSERTKQFSRDIRRATMAARRHAQRPPRAPMTIDALLQDLDILTDAPSILERLRALQTTPIDTLAFDIETTALRPYGEASRVSTIALSYQETGDATVRTITFPWQHAEVEFSDQERAAIGELVRDILREAPIAIAHNAVFECEWMGYQFGLDWLQEIPIDCTMNRAYILDERRGGLSLDVTFFEAHGAHLKAASSEIDVRFVELQPLVPLLRYGGLDTAATLHLWLHQEGLLKKRSLHDSAALQRRRILPAATCQLQGFRIDQVGVSSQKGEAQSKLSEVTLSIAKHPLAVRYAQTNGAFNPSSDSQLLYLLESIDRKECKVEQRDGSFKNSVDQNVLKEIIETGGVGADLCELVVEHRDISKRLSTFVAPYDSTSSASIIFPDGRVHSNMNIAFTATGRWSSSNPNLQNLPSRSEVGKKVRQLFVPPSGYSVVASDYASLEARVIAMCSQDEVWCRMVREGYDAHGEWAEIAARQSPTAFASKIKGAKNWDEADKSQRKEYRAIIKNALVFPAFFGAGQQSIGRSLNMSPADTEAIFERFWDVFAGVKQWQLGQINQYKELGYVTCLSGRRRYGPLPTVAMVLNTPVQGTAADLMSEALANLCEFSRETGRSYLRPYLTVHDEAVFCVPDEHLDDAVMDISKIMGKPWGPWQNVPLQIETEVGPSFGELELFSIVDCPAYGDAPAHRKVYWRDSE